MSTERRDARPPGMPDSQQCGGAPHPAGDWASSSVQASPSLPAGNLQQAYLPNDCRHAPATLEEEIHSSANDTAAAHSSNPHVCSSSECDGSSPQEHVAPVRLSLRMLSPVLSSQSTRHTSMWDATSIRLEELPPPCRLSRTNIAARPSSDGVGGLHGRTWLRARTTFGRLRKMASTTPLIVIAPVLACIAIVVTGEMVVWSQGRQYRDHMYGQTASMASSTASQLEAMLLTWVSPATAVGAVVKERPEVPDLLHDLQPWLAPILYFLQPLNDTSRLAFYPWGLLTATYPLVNTSLSLLNYNIFSQPQFQHTAAALAGTEPGNVGILGPISLLDGSLGFCVGTNVWIPSPTPNRTWGMDRAFITAWALQGITLGNASDPALGLCGSNCAPRRQSDGSFLVFWGFLCNNVRLSVLTDMLSGLEGGQGTPFKVRLTRSNPLGGAGIAEAVISEALNTDSNTRMAGNVTLYESADGLDCSSSSPACVCHDVGTSTHLQLRWTLCISPEKGFQPSWLEPIQISVVVFALLVAAMTLVLMVSMENNRVLLHAMLPKRALRRLALGKTYAEGFRCVSVLFSDIVSYTSLAAELAPEELVELLNDLYSGFDDLVDKHRLYKVETIGDAFMCVGGAPDPCSPQDAARRVALMALDMVQFASGLQTRCNRQIQIRVGIHTGDVTAAVMGKKMPHWCLVGDTVNVSSRMESNSKPMKCQVSASTAALLSMSPEDFSLEPRGNVDIKGKGKMSTFWLSSAAPLEAQPKSA